MLLASDKHRNVLMKENVVLCLQLSSTRRSGKTEKERDTYALKMSPKQNE